MTLLGQADVTVAGLVDAMPPMPVVHHEVPTPFEQKGLIMRTLMEQVSDEGARVELVDGIKVLADVGVGPGGPRPRGSRHPRLGGGSRPRRV